MKTAAWLVGAGLLAACGGGGIDGPIGGTKIGNPDAAVKVELRAISSDPTVVALPQPNALTTGITLGRVIIGVEELKFVRPQADGTCNILALAEDYHYEIDRFFGAELVQGTGLGEHLIDKTDEFCAVALDLEDAGELPAGTEYREFLNDARIYVEGARKDGTPFVIRSTEVRDLPIEFDTLLSFEKDGTFTVQYDVAPWFATLDLEGATPSGGQILIDEDNNVALFNQFEAAVASAVGICRDPDRDEPRYGLDECFEEEDDD